jgi:hypothetical protein
MYEHMAGQNYVVNTATEGKVSIKLVLPTSGWPPVKLEEGASQLHVYGKSAKDDHDCWHVFRTDSLKEDEYGVKHGMQMVFSKESMQSPEESA